MRKQVRGTLIGFVALVVFVLGTSGCAMITRASVASDGTEANASSDGLPFSIAPAISADGRYVTFTSIATNLVAGDTNDTQDVFVHDIVAATTTRVSVASTGAQADGFSDNPAISADGRYITFDSTASNLVAGDDNDSQDVFLRDTVTGTTSLASVMGYTPAISADGRYVTINSGAALVADDTNEAYDVFLRDTGTGTTSRVSVDSTGTEANGSSDSSAPIAISADGRYVTFQSAASNLVAGDTNGEYDVFLRDTVAGTTSRVSVDSTGSQANDFSDGSAISADGRYVTFTSFASNLVGGDTNGHSDAFVHDMVTGTTARVSLDSTNAQGNDGSRSDAISADGRYVTFTSNATNLVAGDTNDSRDVFVRDRILATTTRLSVDVIGREGDGTSRSSTISADGRYVTFRSDASNLVPDDTSILQDVFVKANPQPTVTAVAPAVLPRGATTLVTVTGANLLAGTVLSIMGGGMSVTNLSVVSPTQLTADVTVQAGTLAGARTVLVGLVGTGPRVGVVRRLGLLRQLRHGELTGEYSSSATPEIPRRLAMTSFR